VLSESPVSIQKGSTPRRKTQQAAAPCSRAQAANALAASPFGIKIIAAKPHQM